jgi:hypothetical protein
VWKFVRDPSVTSFGINIPSIGDQKLTDFFLMFSKNVADTISGKRPKYDVEDFYCFLSSFTVKFMEVFLFFLSITEISCSGFGCVVLRRVMIQRRWLDEGSNGEIDWRIKKFLVWKLSFGFFLGF